MAQRVPPTAGMLEAIDEDTCVLRTGAPSLELLAIHLALIGADFEAHEPPELRDHLRQLAAGFSRAAQA